MKDAMGNFNCFAVPGEFRIPQWAINHMPKISTIIPCYFNEDNNPVTFQASMENEKLFAPDLEFEYVMPAEGPKDGTLETLLEFEKSQGETVMMIKLVSNVGSCNAIVSVIENDGGDHKVVIATDLQDPPYQMVKIYENWNEGPNLVIANREERTEGLFKKFMTDSFQHLMKKFPLSNLQQGRFDYVGIPITGPERKIGKSHWILKKKRKLFIDSLISISPILDKISIGIVFGLGALANGLFLSLAKFNGLIALLGWSTLMVVFLFMSSFRMISLVVLSFLWRTFDESHTRQHCFISKVISTRKK